jgi:hypothetical protein
MSKLLTNFEFLKWIKEFYAFTFVHDCGQPYFWSVIIPWNLQYSYTTSIIGDAICYLKVHTLSISLYRNHTVSRKKFSSICDKTCIICCCKLCNIGLPRWSLILTSYWNDLYNYIFLFNPPFCWCIIFRNFLLIILLLKIETIETL